MKWQEIPTPCYVVDEKKLKQNLKNIAEFGTGNRLPCASGTEGIFHVFTVSADRAVYQRNDGERNL